MHQIRRQPWLSVTVCVAAIFALMIPFAVHSQTAPPAPPAILFGDRLVP